MDCSPPGSSVCGIFQARILEWVAISFSRGSSQPRYQTLVSCIAVRFFTIYQGRPWDSVHTLNTYLTLFPLHFKTPFLLFFPRKHQPEYSLTNQILTKIYTRGSWKGARLIKLLSNLTFRSLISFQLPSTKLFKDTQLSLIFMTELIKTFRFFLRLYLIPVSVNKQDFQYCRNSRPSIVPCINYDVCLSAILSVTSVTASANSREIPQS